MLHEPTDHKRPATETPHRAPLEPAGNAAATAPRKRPPAYRVFLFGFMIVALGWWAIDRALTTSQAVVETAADRIPNDYQVRITCTPAMTYTVEASDIESSTQRAPATAYSCPASGSAVHEVKARGLNLSVRKTVDEGTLQVEVWTAGQQRSGGSTDSPLGVIQLAVDQ